MLNDLNVEKIEQGAGYLRRLLQDSGLRSWLLDKGGLLRSYPLPELYRELALLVRDCSELRLVQSCFRSFKQRHFLRIGGREIFGLDDFSKTVQEISYLAQVCLQVGIELLSTRPGIWLSGPRIEAWEKGGRYIRPVVMGMGKLGGGELNYVSDIDLVFLYDCLEEPGGKMDSNWASQWPALLRQFFQTLSRLVDELVSGDRVFRVDLRLRPLGKDGEICCSVDGAVNYYQIAGQTWERQALLKARPVAGGRSVGQRFLDEVRPFVFRRFLDFQAIAELRRMRDRILEECKSSPVGPHYDLKLGRGGIREIEFIVQSFQLIYGGRLVQLDDPNTLRCLKKLEKAKLMPVETVRGLQQAYQFLRRAEHWVQLDQNRQTSKLPASSSDLERMAYTLGFSGQAEQLLQAVEKWSNFVFDHFSQLFSAGPDGPGRKIVKTSKQQVANNLSGSFQDKGSSLEQERLFQEIVFACPAGQELQGALKHLSPSLVKKIKQGICPCLGAEIKPELYADGLLRLAKWFQKAGRRPGLMHLLEQGEQWVEQLVAALFVSEFVFNLIWLQPALIEGLHWKTGQDLDTGGWADRSWAVLERSTSFEESLEVIRKAKNEFFLQVALADLQGRLSVEQVGDLLSFVAEKVINWTLAVVENDLGPVRGSKGLSILGLGKLGTRELGYLSDLDLMFVYETKEKRLPVQVTRLVQRLLSMLSVPMQDGPGYETDAQLRPSGKAGPLIVTAASWEGYYTQQADIWEVQSLLRLRPVGGDLDLGRRLQERAKEICFQGRSPEQVWSRLSNLRQRMERERSREQERPPLLDLKLGRGGLADLEFLAQGIQLIWGYKYSGLRTSRVSQVLETLQAEDLPGIQEIRGVPLADYYTRLHRLDLSWQLFTCQHSGGLTPERMETFVALAYPGAVDWPGVVQLKKKVRKAWSAVSQNPGH